MKNDNNLKFTLSLLIKYAFRSFMRNKRKNAILIMVVAAALVSYIYLSSMLLGMRENSIKNIIQYENGEISLMHKSFFDDPINPVRDTIAFPLALQDDLEALGWQVSPHLQFTGNVILQSPPFPVDGRLPFGVIAIDFDRDDYMQNILSKDIVESKNNADMKEIIDMLDNQDGLLIGQWFAKKISAEIGDTLFIVAKGKGGFIEQLELEIVGIYKSQNILLERNSFIMSYYNANDYLLADEYTNINLLKNPVNPQDNEVLINQKGKIKDLLAKYGIKNTVVKTYREVQLQRNGTLVWDFPDSMALIYTFFILIIAAAGISNSTTMNILTRSKEIATMQAFGMSTGQVALLYTFEMLFVGVLAAILGSIGGVGVMAFLVYKGIDYSIFFADSSWGFTLTQVTGSWDFGSLLKASILGIVFTVLIELYVMWRMKKQYTNIIEMLGARS